MQYQSRSSLVMAGRHGMNSHAMLLPFHAFLIRCHIRIYLLLGVVILPRVGEYVS